MLPKIAYLLEEPDDAERRGATRRTVYLPSAPGIHPLGRRVVLLDLSETGLRLQCSTQLHVGQSIQVNLPHAGEVEARIVWRHNDEYGAKFETSVSKGAVSATILASPAREQRQSRSIERLADRPTDIPPIYAELALLMLLPVVALLLVAFAVLPITSW